MRIYHPCGKCEICFDFCRCEKIKITGLPIKQKNDYTCGPVAIRNACWALGMKTPSVKKIAKICETDINGTSVTGLRRGAKAAGLNLDRVFVSSMNDIDKIVSFYNKSPLILGYTTAGEGHYCVILERYQITPGMGGKYESIALNWNRDTVVAFDSHSNLFAESPITSEWLIGKLLANGTEIYLVSKRK